MLKEILLEDMKKIQLEHDLKLAIRVFLVTDETIRCGILIETGEVTYFAPYVVQKERGKRINYYDYQMKEADDVFLELSSAISLGKGVYHHQVIFEQPTLVIDSSGHEIDQHIGVPSDVIKIDVTDTFSQKGYVDGTYDDELWYAIKSSSMIENADFLPHNQDVLHSEIHLDGVCKPWFFNGVYRIEVQYEFKVFEPMGNEAMFAPSLAAEG